MYKRLNCFFVILLSLFSCSRKVEVLSGPVSEPTPISAPVKIEHESTESFYSCKACNKVLFRLSERIFKDEKTFVFENSVADSLIIVVGDTAENHVMCRNCGLNLGEFSYEGRGERYKISGENLKDLANGNYERAIFASGCFWGTEYFLLKAPGVVSTSCGYIGGEVKNPTYKQVCTGNTGHAEAVEVIYDKSKTDFKTLCKLFFETHNPTQLNRQGPDIGTQYRSEIFYIGEEQRQISEELINELKGKGLDVVTKVTPVVKFYDAEDYHQKYYLKTRGIPYCHQFEKKFFK